MNQRRLGGLITLGALGVLVAAWVGGRAVALADGAPPNAAVAPSGGGVSILDQLVEEDHVTAQHTPDGIVIRADPKAHGAKLTTRTTYHVPVDITLVAKTDSKNLRLFYGNGVIIFNWELGERNLRYAGPRTGGDPTTVVGKGAVPRNTFVTVRWTITENEVRVSVDGEERFSMQGRWDDVSGAIGVGTKGNAVVTVKSLTVAHPKGARPGEGGQPGEGAPSGEGFFIDVPCAKSDATTRAATVPAAAPVTAAATTAPAAAMIERPAFRDAPKPIVKSLSSITAMATLHADDGQAVGATVDLIATVPLESRQGIKAAAGFHRNEVDEATRAEFDEALRAVELRYPIWEPGRIEFSFGGETALPRVGPSSAGTAFAVLMLSCLEGFDVDRNCALTGDVSVDWRVRKAGGVVAGLRAAAASGKCLYAGIPADDAAAIPDMAILHGNDALWATQVFTISNLHEAVALARTDRPDRLAKAIAMFAELRQALTANSRAALHAASTKAKLREILELAPNHLSARCVLALCDGTAPRTLSADATRYQLSAIYYPYLPLLDGNKGKPIDRTTLPKPVTVAARKRLAVLRPIAHKDYQPAVGDVGALIETMDELADHSISLATAERRLQDVQARIGEVVGDAKAVERAVREGY